MDHPQVTHLSLCAGYGGIDLGLRRCIPSLRTIAYSEIEAFACEVLLARMEGGQIDAAPIWPDVKSFPWSDLRDRVDILSGGYPCQPFSSAGKRLGREDPRHLWPYIADGISILRPRLCFFENVEGHISLGLREVIEHLGRLGYSSTWGIFSAAQVGAPHQRKRVFVLAHRIGAGLEGLTGDVERAGRQSLGSSGSTCEGSLPSLWPSRPGQPQFAWEPPRIVGGVPQKLADFCAGDEQPRNGPASASRPSLGDEQRGQDAVSHGGSGVCRGDQGDESGAVVGNARSEESNRLSSRAKRDEMAEAGQPGRRQTQPTLGRDSDGLAGGLDYAELCVSGDSRVDELRLLGNGVVPAVASRAYSVLIKQLIDEEQSAL